MVLKGFPIVISVIYVLLVVCSISRVSSEGVYRLANNTKPLLYEIELRVDPDCDATDFSGHVNITFQVLQTDDFVTFHKSTHITMKEWKIWNERTKQLVDIKDVESIDETEITTITLKDDIEVGLRYVLEIHYTAKISTDKLGFYQSSYLNDDGEKVCLMSTQFAPTQARRAFPCYDEPSFKAEYDIRIIHPKGTTAMSNEMQTQFMDIDDGKVMTIFETVPLMPTYLVGFAVSDFVFEEKISAGLSHRIYARSNEIENVAFALDFAVEVYSYLANYFDYKLPLTQLKHVAIPDFYFSAMENWGMITYKESRFLFDPEVHPANLMHSISNVIAHEVTHHWFGDIVTMKWWTHVWLKEGFATLFSYLGQENVRPEYEAIQFLLAEKLQFVFTIDSDPNIKPMSKYIEKQSDIMANYDKIAYDKACCVLRMWRHALSDDVFKKALRLYIVTHKMNNTEEDDLFQAFEEFLPDGMKNVPVATAMRSWTQQGGYPVVKAFLKNSLVYLHQERFYHKRPAKEPEDPPVWWIPLTFIDLNGNVKKYWFNDTKTQIDCREVLQSCEEGGFFLVNDQQNGYYRVNYEEEHWHAIAGVLKTNHLRIHVNNRAQLVDDALSLSSVGLLSYTAVFDVLEYLGKEEEYAPWAAFKRGISTMKQYLSGNPRMEILNQFVQSIVSQAYQNVALSNNVAKYIRKFSRQIIVSMACEYELQACLQEQRVYDYPDLREVYFCNKIRSGGNNVYSSLRIMLKNTTEPILRSEIISSLGCSTDRSQISVILLLAVDKTDLYKLTESERVQLIQSVYRKSYIGVVETLNFFDNEDVRGTISQPDLDRVALDLAKYINTYDLSLKFDKVMNGLAPSKLTEAKIIIRDNLYWIADYGTTALNVLGNKSNNACGTGSWAWLLIVSVTSVVYSYI